MKTNFKYLQKVEKCGTFGTALPFYLFYSFLLIEKEINTSNKIKSQQSPQKSQIAKYKTKKVPAVPTNFEFSKILLYSFVPQFITRLFAPLKNVFGTFAIDCISGSPVNSPRKSPK